MPTFLCAMNWTDQGIRTVKDLPKRVKAGYDLAKKVGVEIKEIYLTSGEHDLLVIAEAPLGIMSPNSRLQPVRWETCAPAPPELGPSPNGPS